MAAATQVPVLLAVSEYSKSPFDPPSSEEYVNWALPVFDGSRRAKKPMGFPVFELPDVEQHWNASGVTGKLVEAVDPPTRIRPEVSTRIEMPPSSAEPPR